MDPKPPSHSEIASSIRNMAISRRGGVRTRRGRLPPINMREISQATTTKKVFTPNIPPRRRVIKKEVETPINVTIKTEKPDSYESSRGRGRGRRQKTYLQTEGSFLAEGPAARTKKNFSSYESVSTPRLTRKAAGQSSTEQKPTRLMKYDLDSCEDDECDFGLKAPYRLPLQPEKTIYNLKLEPDKHEIKKEIKEEFIVDIETGMPKKIKAETEDEESSSSKDKIGCNVEIDSKKEVKITAEEFQNSKGDGILILLQLPQLSSPLVTEDIEKSSSEKVKQSEESEGKVTSSFLNNFEEGFIGKLQIMKSGRMKITLGSVEFELLDGSPSESYREVVSVQIQEGDGNLAILGKVDKKMMLNPIINTLIMNKVNQN